MENENWVAKLYYRKWVEYIVYCIYITGIRTHILHNIYRKQAAYIT